MHPKEGQSRRSTAINRRNHYRVLHVQPDAPPEVIRSTYRTLMQKLKLHPDLGGDHWTAVHVNAAYAVLSDPVRRAAYDRELLASYDIATLSRGPLQPESRPTRGVWRAPLDDQRNFYRVLQVQADAPLEVIEASHRALSSRDAALPPSLTEALATLRDPARREVYDRALGLRARASRPAAATTEPAGLGVSGHPAVHRKRAYEPIVTGYCLFCKTPHHASPSALEEARCVECASPLCPPQADFLDQARRALGRSPQNEELGFYTFWPGTRFEGRLLDLSPTGLRFIGAEPCDVGDIIKIDARRLQAVGAIVHRQHDRAGATAGVRFHAVGFAMRRGSFVSTRA